MKEIFIYTYAKRYMENYHKPPFPDITIALGRLLAEP